MSVLIRNLVAGEAIGTRRRTLAFGVVMVAAALLASVALFLAASKPAEAAFPGANGKIAFSSNRTTGPGVTNPTGDEEIFTMNPNGTGLLQATFNTAFDFWPAWSPDGNKIAFSSNLSGNNNHEIYMMDPNGAQQAPLTDGASSLDWAASWSPDGKQIAFASNRDGDFEIFVMDTNPLTNDTPLKLTNNTAAIDSSPAWSPNGKQIAFESSRDGDFEIFVMNPDGSAQKGLTKNATDDGVPDWSPSGGKIAFTRYRGADNNQREIFVMSTDGSAQKRLTRNPADDEDPAWSPNGKKIAFASDRGGDDDIIVMNPDGSRQKNRTNNAPPVADWGPAWQPIN